MTEDIEDAEIPKRGPDEMVRVSWRRTVPVTVGAIALAEIVAMAVLEVLKRPPFWPATLVDATIMASLMFPVLWVLIFRPLNRLVEKRRRAEDNLRRRTRELEALYAVTSAATRDLDVDRLLSEVLEVVVPAFEADAGWVQVLGGGPAGPSRFVAAHGVPASLVDSETPEIRPSCATCRGWLLDDPASAEASAVAECLSLPGDALQALGFRQHLGVLLPIGDRAGAILNLVWRVPRPCGDSQASLLRAIGRQVGIAVKNAALFQAEQRARQAADTIRSASLAITRSLDVEDVFAALLDHLGRLVPYDRAKVMLFESESRLKVRAVFSPSGKIDFAEMPFDSFDTTANSAVSEVLLSKRSVCVADTHALPVWGGQLRPDIERSWLGVPLLAGGEAIGLYTLVKAEPGFFTPEHVHLVESLYAPASVAIANAGLFEEARASRHRQQILSRQLVDVQESERRKVARELHDEAGQLLSSLMVGLRVLERKAGHPDAIVAHARELRQIADAAQEGLYRLATDLRPAVLDHLGLVPALGQLAAKLSGNGGPVVRVETLGFDGKRFAADLETALYRIAQEALTNAVRHSFADQVSLVVESRDGQILMVVEDDGRGFDVEAATRSGRLGLMGIRERAEMLGGSLLVESSPGSGATLVVEVPSVS